MHCRSTGRHFSKKTCHTGSVEGLQLVGLHRGLVLVQVGERVLGPVVVGIIVGVDGLGLQAGDGVELLDRRGAQAGQGPEDRALDLRHLGVLHRVHEGVLGLRGVVLELVARERVRVRVRSLEMTLKRANVVLARPRPPQPPQSSGQSKKKKKKKKAAKPATASDAADFFSGKVRDATKPPKKKKTRKK